MSEAAARSASVGLVFDLDGTLIDSAGAIMAVGDRLLAERGLAPLDLAETKRYIGSGAAKFVERALAARGVSVFGGAYERFEALYADADPRDNIPYEGVYAAIRALRDAGHPLAICTNKPGAPTAHAIDALGWSGLFDAVVAGDTLAVRKPDPAPLVEAGRRLGVATVLFIGDSEVDAETAARAGVPFLLFTEGYRKSPVDALTHRAAFSRYADLSALIASIATAP